MRYRGSLLIKPTDTEADPAAAAIELCYGTITEIEVMFPAGHAGVTRLQIWYQERQIFPTTPGEAFRGDDHVIAFDEAWEIHEVPHRVELRGWSIDAEYNHRVFVDISMKELPPERLEALAFVPLPEGMEL